MIKLLLSALAPLALVTQAQAAIHITEFFYQGYGGVTGNEHEFVELTNTGATPIDLTGWRYSDVTSDYASGFDLSPLGLIAPGQSVIITDISEEDFRIVWPGLDASVLVLGNLSPGLGRNDSIVIFDAGEAIADRLDYGDEVIPGTPRWRRITGITSPDNLGANDISGWVFSNDAAGWHDGLVMDNLTSINGDTGNPGYVNFNVIPEPSAVLLSGFGALALLRRRC